MNTTSAPVFTTIDDLQYIQDELATIRQGFHQRPELAYKENATSSFIIEKLKSWGYTVTTGIAGTGLVATMKVGAGTKRLGLRADMDALPIAEQTGLPYASEHTGLMHACGHDGHMTMLLGAAKHLALTKNFSGTLNLIFQPAEEAGFNSGGKTMVEEGLFDRFPCDVIYAIHNHPGAPQGEFLFREGTFLAAGDRVFIKVFGHGGHAARPHHSVDTVVVCAAIVMALQTIVSRNIDPNESAVVTVGRMRCGDALNVIPAEGEIGISVRSFDPEVRKKLKDRIERICHSTAEAYDARVEIDYIAGYPVVDNDIAANALALSVARELVGEDDIVENTPRRMGSEDFAYMQQVVPGALVRLGNGPSDGGRDLHNPKFDFNDANLSVGAAFWCRLTERFLSA
ncbi:M20 aminoacylase family protein [Alcaligenaceae bacterium B3P038]|nr:M20 aminoacylase family protein [Alcaligenaceae bacterium B3P038]